MKIELLLLYYEIINQVLVDYKKDISTFKFMALGVSMNSNAFFELKMTKKCRSPPLYQFKNLN